jgi:hypothetical protein
MRTIFESSTIRQVFIVGLRSVSRRRPNGRFGKKFGRQVIHDGKTFKECTPIAGSDGLPGVINQPGYLGPDSDE